MIIVLAAAFGFYLGWRRATARNGDRMDKIQYGIAHAIAFALVGFVVSLILVRLV